MRWVLDLIAVLTLAGLIAGVVHFNREQNRGEAVIAKVIEDLHRLELEIKYRGVTKSTELNDSGWPATIDPKWFENDPPRNRLVSPKRPWLEVAPERDARLTHPRVRVAMDEGTAAFWYNPYQGVVRARIPEMLSDDEALTLYNRINATALKNIFEAESDDAEPAPAELAPVEPAPAEPPPEDLDPTKPLTNATATPPVAPALDPGKAANAFSRKMAKPQQPSPQQTHVPTGGGK